MLMAAAASTCVRTKRFPVTQVSPHSLMHQLQAATGCQTHQYAV